MRCCAWTMYGLKCLIEVAIAKASISHGSQETWRPRSLALKKPATSGFWCLVTYRVDPMLCFLTDPSVTVRVDL